MSQSEFIDIEKELGLQLTAAQQKEAEKRKLQRMAPRLPKKQMKKVIDLAEEISARYRDREGTPNVYLEMMKEIQGRFDDLGYKVSVRFMWATQSMPEPKQVTAATVFPSWELTTIVPEISLDLDNPDKKLEFAEETIYEREKRREAGGSYWDAGAKEFRADSMQDAKGAAAIALKKKKKGKK